MFPMWAMGQAGVWLTAGPWQRPQGVRATNKPITRTVRLRIESNFFIVEYYALFREIANHTRFDGHILT
jgi:hypothetical protein